MRRITFLLWPANPGTIELERRNRYAQQKQMKAKVFLLLCGLLLIGAPAVTFAGFWEDAGRVAAAVATGGQSELVLQLISQVVAIRDYISQQADQANNEAINEVLKTVQAQYDIVTAAESRVNAAAERGRQVAQKYITLRGIGSEQAGTLGGGAVGRSQATKAEKYATQAAPAGKGSAASPVPADDVTVIRQAEAKLLGVAQDFRNLAAETRRALQGIPIEAQAHVSSIKVEIKRDFLDPLENLLSTLYQIAKGSVCTPEWNSYYFDYLKNYRAAWEPKMVSLRGEITGPAFDKINAANAGRATPVADWEESFARLIEAATQSGSNGAQSMNYLRKELGLSVQPLMVYAQTKVQATTVSMPLAASSGNKAGAMERQNTMEAQFSAAQTTLKRMEQAASRIDVALVRSVDSQLAQQFRGVSPQQLQVRRASLLNNARLQFSGQPQSLKVIEQMIDRRAAGLTIWVDPKYPAVPMTSAPQPRTVSGATERSLSTKTLNPQPLPPKR